MGVLRIPASWYLPFKIVTGYIKGFPKPQF